MFNKINSFGVIVGVKEELNIINKYNVLVKIGYGKVNARKVARELAKKVDCIVSFGFAGSLDPNLNNGHVIIPKNLVTYNNKQKLKLSQKYPHQRLLKLPPKYPHPPPLKLPPKYPH